MTGWSGGHSSGGLQYTLLQTIDDDRVGYHYFVSGAGVFLQFLALGVLFHSEGKLSMASFRLVSICAVLLAALMLLAAAVEWRRTRENERPPDSESEVYNCRPHDANAQLATLLPRVVRGALAAGHHGLLLTWLAAGCFLGGVESRLVAGAFLAAARGIPWWEAAVCLALQLGSVAFEEGKDSLPGAVLGVCTWAPALLFAVRLSDDVADLRPGRGRDVGHPERGLARKLSREVDALDAPANMDIDGNSLPRTGSRVDSQMSPRTQSSATKERPKWLEMALWCFPEWRPPNEKKISGWKKLFSLSEQLLAVYVGAVRATLTHRGHLYLSTGHVCFHGVAIVKALQFTLPLDDIEEVRRGEHRDIATLVLRRPLLMMKGMKHRVMSIELRGCEKGSLAISSLLAQIGGEEKTLLDDRVGSSDSDDGFGQYEITSPKTAHSLRGDNERCRTSNLTYTTCTNATVDATAKLFSSESSTFKQIMEASIQGLDFSALVAELLAETWDDDQVLVAYFLKQGATELSPGPWTGQGLDPLDSDSQAGSAADSYDSELVFGPVVRVRELDMRMPVPPGPMCPKTTRMTMTYMFSLELAGQDGCIMRVESSAVSHDVPFGSNFLVQERTNFQTLADGIGVHMVKHCRVVFVRSCGFLKSRIETASIEGCTKGAGELVDMLRSHRPKEDSSPADQSRSVAHDGASSRSGVCDGDASSQSVVHWFREQSHRSTVVVGLWELQRRATLFHSEWHAPFLPHDGRRRWRWLDGSYVKHPWTKAVRREEVAASTFPPLSPPKGWTVWDTWSVDKSRSHGPTDGDGWQYANEFYKNDRRWSASPIGHHVRRRFWACGFVEDNEVSSDDSVPPQSH